MGFALAAAPGAFLASPIEGQQDPPSLDAHRQRVGLPPLAEYKKIVVGVYRAKVR